MAENAGYEIKKVVLHENHTGFALGECPGAPAPFVTWQFNENAKGKRDYYWGHYFADYDAAARDLKDRVDDYQRRYGVIEVTQIASENYRYYSTQRPVDIGTFPKTEAGPIDFQNYNQRQLVEDGTRWAWGTLTYTAPLTQAQMDNYELKPSRHNPDVRRQMEEQSQTIGKWEQTKCISEEERLTYYHAAFRCYAAKEFVSPEQLAACCRGIELQEAARAHKEQKAKPSIAAQLAEGANRAAKENAARPTPEKKAEKDR